MLQALAHSYVMDDEVLLALARKVISKSCISKKDAIRVARAIKAKRPPTMKMRSIAKANEQKLARWIKGGEWLKDNEPFDVLVRDAKGHISHMVEVKTIFPGIKEAKVTMRRPCRLRKLDFAKKYPKAKVHTIIFDERVGKVLYKEGVGSFRLSAAKEVKLADLKKMLGGADVGKAVKKKSVPVIKLTKAQKEAIAHIDGLAAEAEDELVNTIENILDEAGHAVDKTKLRADLKEFKKAFNKDAEICINRHLMKGSNSYRDVLKTGKLKNQFVVANEIEDIEKLTSGGAVAPGKGEMRDSWEQALFGKAYQKHKIYEKLDGGEVLPLQLAKERPQYGYVYRPVVRSTHANGIGYGNVGFVLKDDLKKAATMTTNNSSMVDYWTVENELHKNVATFAHPENLITINDIHKLRRIPKSVDELRESYNYYEVQIHQQIDLKKHVKKIRLFVNDYYTREEYLRDYDHIFKLADKYDLDVEVVKHQRARGDFVEFNVVDTIKSKGAE